MDQIEEIKSKIDIVELISEYLPLKKTGRNFKALCPFHSETVPSFIVSPERQIFKCFGCGEGGDIFGFLMKMEGMEFGEALQTLAQRAGVKLRAYRPSESEKQKQLLYQINHLAAEFYHYLLLNHPVGRKALDYILGRGIRKESLQLFKLGFAPYTWDSLQKFLVGKKGYRAEDLERAGLVIKSSKGSTGRYYDRFRGRLMFPLKDHRGNVCGFAGRVLVPEAKEAKYINTPETLIYHKSALLYGLDEVKEEIKKADQVILVEGELDMISSYQAGVKNVVAIKGAALTSQQIRLLSRFTQNIVFALDRDPAGDQAARRGIEIADQAGMTISVVRLKEGKDPDEVAQKNPRLWQKLVQKAVPVYDYLLDEALARFGVKTAEGKRKVSEAFLPVLIKINNEVVKAYYLQKLAEKLGVKEEVIALEMIKRKEKETKEGGPPSVEEGWEKREERSRREILEEHLLALGFLSGQWRFLRKRKVLRLVKTPRFQRILEVLGRYLRKYQTQQSQRLAKMLPVELRETFDRLYLLELGEVVDDKGRWEREIEKTQKELEKLELREEMKEISQEISRLEKKERRGKREKQKLEKLHQHFRDLSLRLGRIEEG